MTRSNIQSSIRPQTVSSLSDLPHCCGSQTRAPSQTADFRLTMDDLAARAERLNGVNQTRVHGIVSCAQLYRIPLLMLISYRGEFGERDPWQTEGGGVTEDLLRALRIPYAYLDSPDHVASRIRKAQTLATSANKPVALLLCRDLMWEEPA